MARDVLIRLKKLSTTGKVPANAAVRFEPTVLRADADGYILDDYFDAVMVDGEATVTDLPETDLNWAYKVQVRGHGRGAGLKQVYATWYVHLPEGEGTVNFEDLPRIDPKTLTPVNDPDPAWVDAVTAVFNDSVSTAVEPAMVTAAEDETSQFRSALNAATAQSITDETSPVHAAVVTAVGGSIPEGVVTSQDFGTMVIGTDPNEELPLGTIAFYLPQAPTLFTTFSTSTVGAVPTGWTPQWSTGRTWAVATDAGATDGVVLRATGDLSNTGLAWDAIAPLLEGETGGEIVFKWRSGHEGQPMRSIINGSGAAGTETGYHAGLRNATTAAIGKFDNGTQHTVIGTEAAFASPVNTWMVTRHRWNTDGTLMARTWRNSQAEPTGWQVTATNTDFSAGWWGLSSRAITAPDPVHEIDWVGFAAGTHTAPKGA